MPKKSGRSGRLKQALERAGINQRHFHELMRERIDRGSSYGSIHNYLTGKSEPPMEFLMAAAEVLGVAWGWLIEGSGEMTPSETAAIEATEGAARSASVHKHREDMERVLQQNLSFYPMLRAHAPLASAAIWETYRRLSVYVAAKGASKTGTGAELMAFIGETIQSFVDRAPIDFQQTRRWQIEEIALGICGAIRALIPDPNVGEHNFNWLKPNSEKEETDGSEEPQR